MCSVPLNECLIKLLFSTFVGSREFVAVTNTMDVKYIDPIGAILISIYILVNWWRTGYGKYM